MYLFIRKGFSLVEIMIVVAIIAIALAIAIPNLGRMSTLSKKTVCIDNLRKMTSAVEQWAIDNNIPAEVNVTQGQEAEIFSSYLRGGRPVCPSGGEYILNPVGVIPQVQCTREDEGHTL